MTPASWMLLPSLALTVLAVRSLARLMHERPIWRIPIPPAASSVVCAGFGLWASTLWMRALVSGAIDCIAFRGSVCRVPVYTAVEHAGGFWLEVTFSWVLGTALIAVALTEFRRWRLPPRQ